MRKYASARGKKKTRKRPSAILVYGESIRISVHGSHNVLWKRHHRNVIVCISFLRGAVAVEARRRRPASARIYIYIRFRPRGHFMPGAKWTRWPPFA